MPERAGLPILFTAGLVAFALYPGVRETPRLLWSILGAGAVLVAWTLALLAAASVTHRSFTVEISLRKQHYVQACAHTSIFLYWGWFWQPVYDNAYLIVAQLCFAYAFDMLLSWSRRDTYTLGFGPFPIVLSTNLFLWFKPDWFYLQFLMIAVGFAAKEFIRWNKDGRQAHIFNPSAFSLTIFSAALILTGTSDITWGKDIAITQFYPPRMYLFLFLIALPGQLLFGVTTMTMSAVVTTYLFGLMYYAVSGTYYFYDSYIPIAVFLGMHLLFTDPSTAPRTEAGRVIFGALYGLSTIALYQLLGAAGLPAFYDKLLQVPLLNLSIRAIDRMVRSEAARTARTCGQRAGDPVRPPASRVCLRLGGCVRGHERDWRSGGLPSRTVDPLLAAGLPAESRPRLPVSGAAVHQRVQRGLRLVLQRVGQDAGQRGRRGPLANHRTSTGRGASDPVAWQQRPDRRPEPRVPVRARLRPGLAR